MTNLSQDSDESFSLRLCESKKYNSVADFGEESSENSFLSKPRLDNISTIFQDNDLVRTFCDQVQSLQSTLEVLEQRLTIIEDQMFSKSFIYT